MPDSIDPTDGRTVATYAWHDDGQVEHALARSWDAFRDWRGVDVAARSALLGRVADLLDDRATTLAELMVTEMGKTLAAARSEVAKSASLCRYAAEHAAAHLAPEPFDVEAARCEVRFDPLGPLLAVMPWNFPLWQVVRAAIPALAAGNSVLLKHAPNVTGCALAIEDVLVAADAPQGLFQTLVVPAERVAGLIADDRVRGVTVTGSPRAGRAVAAAAGEHLVPSVLELGGSDPFVVLADADLDAAASTAATARLQNNGQSCIAAKRFLVVAEAHDEFVERFSAEVDGHRVGDPMDDDTDIGPMAREDLRDALADQVERTLHDGARAVRRGGPGEGPGWWYEPTVLAGVDPMSPAAQEETFGPAAAVMEVAGQEEAIALANASPYGLGASVWTADLDRAAALVPRIEAGAVFVNAMVASDPRVPFGGVKDSGYGRELSRWGTRSFVDVKTVWMQE